MLQIQKLTKIMFIVTNMDGCTAGIDSTNCCNCRAMINATHTKIARCQKADVETT